MTDRSERIKAAHRGARAAAPATASRISALDRHGLRYVFVDDTNVIVEGEYNFNLVGSLWVLKKLLAPRGESAGLLRVVAGTAVGTRERVVIVEVGATWLVLGVAPGRVSALAEVPRQSAAAQTARPSPSGEGFPDWLRKLTPRR